MITHDMRFMVAIFFERTKKAEKSDENKIVSHFNGEENAREPIVSILSALK